MSVFEYIARCGQVFSATGNVFCLRLFIDKAIVYGIAAQNHVCDCRRVTPQPDSRAKKSVARIMQEELINLLLIVLGRPSLLKLGFICAGRYLLTT